MAKLLYRESEFSGRKNGFYKKISALETDDKTGDKDFFIKYDPASGQFDNKESFDIVHFSNDNSIVVESDGSIETYQGIYQEIKAIRDDLQKLENNVGKKEKSQYFKSEKIRDLEKVSEKNTEKIEKIEKGLSRQQEKILKFEGIFKEVELRKLSELREQDLLRPCLSERKIVTRHIYKDCKVNSVVSSPKINAKDGLGKLRVANNRK